ncbi:MAG: Ribonuclease D [Pseudomonas citronellolis]|nr:MAG: Ribonuclease D [Pseudomonas citronellolis]
MSALDIQWIRDDASLARQCQLWKERPYLALDTEFMRVDTYYPKAGLVQVGDGQSAWLIDPLLIRDWSPFAALLEAPEVVKVFHACGEDLEVFQRLTGSLPAPLFDTQLAAAFVGLPHSMGYSKLVLELLGVELPKDETRSDWLQRPLTDMQMRYAADDVLHLGEVYLKLEARLDPTRRAWLLADGADLVRNQLRVSDPRKAYREVKLAWKLSRPQLAVLRELCVWREEQARLRNQPRNRVLREQTLWPLARFQPADKVALARIDEMHPRTVRQDGDTLLGLMAHAAALPADQWPETLPEPLPREVTTLLKQLREVGQREAERLGMAPELMLRKKILEALIKSGYPNGPYALPEALQGWRRELMDQALLDCLANPPTDQGEGA